MGLFIATGVAVNRCNKSTPVNVGLQYSIHKTDPLAMGIYCNGLWKRLHARKRWGPVFIATPL